MKSWANKIYVTLIGVHSTIMNVMGCCYTCVCMRIYPLGDGPTCRLVIVVSLNKLQSLLSHVCDNSPVSVKLLFELAMVHLN